MWRQVRGERGRERGREAFDDEMLSHQDVPRLRRRVVAAARRDRGASAGCATPSCWPGSPRACSAPRSSGCSRSRGVATASRLGRGRAAARRAALRARRRARPAHEDDHQLDELSSAADLQELTTAADREYAPSGRAWAPPTHRIEDDAFAHVLVDEAQDLTPMQWRMVGRRGRGRLLDDRRRPGAVVVAGAGGVRRGPGRRARGQAAPRVPPVDQLPQLRGDLRARRGVRRAGRAGRRPADRRPVDRGRAERASPASPTSRQRPARRSPASPGRSRARSASWCRSPAAPR